MGTSNRNSNKCRKRVSSWKCRYSPIATFFSILFRLPSTHTHARKNTQEVRRLLSVRPHVARRAFASTVRTHSLPHQHLPTLLPSPLCLPHLLPFFVPRVVIDFRQATAALTLTYLLPLATSPFPYHPFSAVSYPSFFTTLCVSSPFATSFGPLFLCILDKGD